MLELTDLKPVFFAPFVSSVMQVEPGWIDYNGHMNVAYYTALFDQAFDEALQLLGAGLDYVKRERHSYFTVESHARHLRELLVDTPVRVTVQLLGYDAKRLHLFQQLYHATEGWMAATLETLALHVDVDDKRVVAAPPAIAERLAEMRKAHALLPIPEAAGRRIKMPAHG